MTLTDFISLKRQKTTFQTKKYIFCRKKMSVRRTFNIL